jgi:hypothetical protein
VRFYMAETVLALLHLHAYGLMYRDLKVSGNCHSSSSKS